MKHHQCTIGEILKYLNVPRHGESPALAEVDISESRRWCTDDVHKRLVHFF